MTNKAPNQQVDAIDGRDIGPWYHQPWAWFVLSPLIVVVFVSAFTVSVAVKDSDDRIVDDYYKEGRMINKRFEQDELAQSIGLQAQLELDNQLGELTLRLSRNAELSESWPEWLSLNLYHPAKEAKDEVIVLRHIARGQYRAELDKSYRGRWYLRLQPALETATGEFESVREQWRLNAEVDFSSRHQLQF